MLATDSYSAAADLILAKTKTLSGKITGARIMSEISQLVKDYKDAYGQSQIIEFIVGTKDALYQANSSVAQYDFCSSNFQQTCKCAYMSSQGMSTVERILYVYRAVERTRNISLFPISVYDVRTGKRQIFQK